MNKEDEDRQIRETRSLLQKAGQRNASLETRRDALRRLISLTHTPSPDLKVFAAQNFSNYFKDFPDLEEDVIDSVYDICEDPDAQVRIEGYKAIVALSTEAKKWTRRNTDVLVQLLQSDEPQELKQIKDSLKAHVNLDAAAAIGVMCDHCSLDPDLGTEDREDREKLRKIVLLFFANDAKEVIFGHFRGPTSEPEQVFREGLLKAIGRADVQDTERIVKELLLPLGSYSTRSEYGDELLRDLLDKVKLLCTDLKSKPSLVSLDPLRPYLSLLEYIAVHKRVADPGPLLRFYNTTLIGKMALQKLDQESQMAIIQRLADILSVCEDERSKLPKGASHDDLVSLRNAVVDACPHVIDRIVKAPIAERRPWKASLVLLKACRQRQDDQAWTPPTNFTHSLRELNTRAEQAPGGVHDVTEQIQKLMKEFHIEPSKPMPPHQLERSGSSMSANKRKFESESGSTPVSGLRKGSVSTSPHDDRPVATRKEFRPPTPSTSAQGTAETSPRGPKLINRIGGDVSTGERSSLKEPPTLLRRMSTSDGNSANGTRLQRPARSPSDAGLSASTAQMAPMMLSIKGAASKQGAKEIPPQPVATPTLIDRMQVDDQSHDAQAGRKKKKRTKGGGSG